MISRRTYEEWKELVLEFNNSGLNIIQFCEGIDLKASTFIYWVKKFNQPAVKATKLVKPLVMGRKNIFFAGITEGADAMCFYYSLIETAKLNSLNPYAYLKWLFEKTPLLKEDESLEILAPWNCSPEEVNRIMLVA